METFKQQLNVRKNIRMRIKVEREQKAADNEVARQKLSVDILRRPLESSEEDTLETPLPPIDVLHSVPED